MALKDDANELKGILGEINQTLQNTQKEGFGLSEAIQSSQDSMRGLVEAAQEYAATQTDEKNFYEKRYSFTKKELSSLQEKLSLNKQNLQSSDKALLQEIQASKKVKEANQNLIKKLKLKSQSEGLSEGEKAVLSEALRVNKDINNSLKDQLNQHKLNKKALKDSDDSLKDIEDSLNKSGKSPFHDSIKKVGDNVNTFMKNPLMAIGGIFTFLFKKAMDVDKYVGKMGKDLNIGYDAAVNLNREFTDFANSSLDPAINQERMAEATTSVNTAMGTTHRISNEQLGTMIKMNKYSNISYQDQAKMLKTSKALGETYEGYVKSMMGTIKAQKFENNLALNAKKIMLDVNNVSDRTKISISGGSEGLAKAAVEAAKLGTNLDGVAGIADSLLDFEQSITNELEAELLTGKDLNLERARGLALNNDFEGVAREINNQLDSAADFGKMNRIQQEAMAKAVGMTADQLGTMLIEQEAIKAVGGDLNDKEKAAYEMAKEKYGAEKAAQMLKDDGLKTMLAEKSAADKKAEAEEKFQNALAGLAAAFLPFFNMLLDVANVIMPAIVLAIEPFRYAIEMINGLFDGSIEKMGTMKIAIGAITTAFMGYIAYQKISKALTLAKIAYQKTLLSGEKSAAAIKNSQTIKDKASAAISIIKGAWSSLGVIPFIGAGLAVAAIGGGIAYLISQASKANDMYSPGGSGGGYGNRTLFGPEGAIQLNNKDTVIAGTNLFGDDTVSEPGKATEMKGKGEIQVQGGNSNMSDVITAINSLANRPISVEIDGKEVIKATTEQNPKEAGNAVGVNNYQIQ